MQTLRRFDNGPAVLAAMASARFTGRPDDLTFRHGSLAIRTPNRRGARVPVYELFVEDSYQLGWFTAGLSAPHAVDIGAHVGCFALSFVSELPGSTVSCFEATPSTYEYLAGNVATNGLGDRIATHNVAVAGTTGTLDFAVTGPGSGHNGILHLDAPDTESITVPCVTIADAFARSARPVELVKIDAEGAEYDMILSSSPDDWASVRRVVLEYHDVAGHEWGELEAFFRTAGIEVADRVSSVAGYGLVWLSRDPLGPRP